MEEQRPINVADYNYEEGKLVASMKWLITRIFEDNEIPDKLQRLFLRDDEQLLHLSPNLVGALVNGTLYAQAASKILQDSSLLMKPLGAVLKALATADIEVRDAEGAMVVEDQLTTEHPFKLQVHLSLIDALMTAHMKSIISIERVVQAVSVYTSVDKREEPLDCVDALLFWINKICLLVRDDVERHGVMLRGAEDGADPTIPEMEDLYEDLCDGTCVCSLLAFYRPHEVDLRDIYFTDPISISDCTYNLSILKNFCTNCLPYNPFHFEIEDILYLHESLQPNVNAFLADLFTFFEPLPEPQIQSPVQRRFAPIQAIPDLRAQNLAQRPIHPPKINRNSYGSSQRDRTMSVASADSLMTTGSNNSRSQKPKQFPIGVPTTHFGVIGTEQPCYEEPTGATPNFKALTEMRLAFEEKRRDHEKKLALNSAMKEEERIRMGKDAFFKLMSRSGHEQQHQEDPQSPQRPYEGAVTAREIELSAQLDDIREELKNLKVMQQKSMGNLTNVGMSHANSQPSLYNDLYQQQQQQLYGTLPHRSPHQPPPPQMYGQEQRNSSFGMPYGSPQQPPYYPQQVMDNHHYALPNTNQPSMMNPNLSGGAYPNYYAQNPPPYPGNNGFQLHQSNSQGALHMAHQMNQPPYGSPMAPQMNHPQYYPQQPLPPNQMSYSMYENPSNGALISPPPAPESEFTSPQVPNANTFRLHQPYASSSRLDPALELNRNLTNWGLTYRAEERTPRKTWANVSQEQPREEPVETPRKSSTINNIVEHDRDQLPPQPPQPPQVESVRPASPPKDPDSRSPEDREAQEKLEKEKNHNNNTPHKPYEAKRTNSGLVVADISGAGENNSEWTAEMEARRQALLMNQMRRKEQTKNVVEDKRTVIGEKQREEIRRQEMAEQRKLERELKRQKVLEEYKRKKAEQDLSEMSGSVSARGSISSTGSLNRGHSQPPFGRPKSQSNMSSLQIRSMQRSTRAQSSVTDENLVPRVNVPALADPTLKLYAKVQPKSNRSLIMNALQYSVFPGAVSNDQRNKVQAALAQSDSKHFLVLFRDHKCQYRGLYTWDQQSDTVQRIEGTGPKIAKEEMMSLMFKYDSGSKHFNNIPTKSLSATIDGFTIQDQFWQKPKIPHSRGV